MLLFFLSFCFLLIKKIKIYTLLSLGLLLNLFLKLLKIVLGIFKTYITKKSRKGMKKHMHISSRFVDNKLMRWRPNHIVKVLIVPIWVTHQVFNCTLHCCLVVCHFQRVLKLYITTSIHLFINLDIRRIVLVIEDLRIWIR